MQSDLRAYADAHPAERSAILLRFAEFMGAPADADQELSRLGDKVALMGEHYLQVHDDRTMRGALMAVYRIDGKLAKVRPHLDYMLKADPKDVEANLGLAAWLLGQVGSPAKLDDIAKCLDLAKEGVAKLPQSRAAYQTDLAIYLELKGDHERALQLIDLAVQAAPGAEAPKEVKALLNK